MEEPKYECIEKHYYTLNKNDQQEKVILLDDMNGWMDEKEKREHILRPFRDWNYW